MAINEDIYGDSTQWEDYWQGSCKMTSYSLWSKVRSGDWELNEPIDNSVCYCGAIGNFYAANPIAFFKTNNERVLMYPETNVHNMLFMLNRANKDGWAFDGGSIRGTNNKWSEWNNIYDLPEYYNMYSSQIMFNFKLNKLLFVPYVAASETNTINASSTEYTLGDWIKNHSVDHPYLHQVYLTTYYNRGTIDNPEWASAEVDSGHYIWLNKNAEFSPEFYNRGDRNVKISYCIGAKADERQRLIIMGLGKSSGADSITDAIPFTSTPIGFDSDLTHYIYDDNENPSSVRYIRAYSEDLVKEIYSQIAFLGVFFLGEGDGSFDNVKLTSDRVYLGTIEEGGYTYGNYTHGEENADQPQYSWEDTSESDYDPNATPPIPDNWKTDFPYHLTNGERTLTNHWYLFNETDLYGAFLAINEVDLENLDLNSTYGMNPIDGVLQTRRVYFNKTKASQVLNVIQMDLITIGVLVLPLPSEGTTPPRQIYSYYVKNNIMYDFDCGYIDVTEPKGMHDFRAYSPFTSAVFYDAFCGITEIDPSKFLNKTLKVVQTVDFLTGDKITSLYAKPLGSSDTQYCRIATVQGNCAEELPINGLATSDYQRNKYMLAGQMALQAIGTFGKAAMGAAGATISAVSNNPAGASLQGVGTTMNTLGGVGSLILSQHEYAHLIPSAVRVSNGSANVESGLIFPPMIIMFNPRMIEEYNQEQYKLLTGFAGYKVDTLENCGVGTHVVSHPKLEIPCTSSEMYMIQDQLQKGIFVKEEPAPEPTPNQ